MEYENEILDLFSKHVAERFTDLLPPSTKDKDKDVSTPAADSSVDSPYFVHPNFLSISWFRCLLDAFLCCEAEFKAALIMGRDPPHFAKPPLDRLIPELLDRSVKALDVSNAITSGIELARQWQKLAQIAVSALEQRPFGEGQVRRAKKALTTLLGSMLSDDKENPNHKAAERSWSFGGPASKDRAGGNFRSFSWSVAKSWSASKQIQAMSSNLVAPRGGEQTGLALPVYIMSNVLVFAMWALVAGIPCQERAGLSTHLNVPRQLDWAKPMMSLHEKISEEWKKKEKKGAAGLLEEIQKMEKLAKSLIEFADSFEFPVDEEKAEQVAEQVAGLAEVCRVMEEGLMPLQQQVREVFHRLVRSRAEILDVVDQIGKSQTPSTPYLG
ncbi:hypothetical protein Leryth_001667 [Lithospermum erythrorhizon]|uniref:Uncharacterized protein n=1 Tax=Lithospermum erythrorhizon TaxID=34254 RepID=A0AAV3Q6Q6_LITER|nr:hypothetical protein Leryth_001667 [Lithospermum erythrorhizon]